MIAPAALMMSLASLYARLELKNLRFLMTGNSMNAEAVGGAMIDGGENRYLPVLFREGGGRVRSPQLVRRVDDDCSFVWVARPGGRGSAWRKQLILSHQP